MGWAAGHCLHPKIRMNSSLPLHLVEPLPIRPPIQQSLQTPIHPTEGLDIASTHGYGTTETCPFLIAANVYEHATTAILQARNLVLLINESYRSVFEVAPQHSTRFGISPNRRRRNPSDFGHLMSQPQYPS